MPLPELDRSDDPRRLPGGTGLTTASSDVIRGTGYALGFKNLAFSEGFDDFAEAEVEITHTGAVVRTAAIEVGQGMVTVIQQIARTALGVSDVEVEFVDTSRIGSAGSTSASRQTQMSGGAVLEACQRLRSRLLASYGGDAITDEGLWNGGTLIATLSEVSARGDVSERVEFHHPPTNMPDEDGQGNPHVDFCIGAQRAVVDVDPGLGLIRVVQIDTAQDVGFALNPVQVIGQIEGGAAQGIGHAVMEELIYDDGVLLNANFTDYLIPTFLDMPHIEAVLVEEPSSWGPFGAKGFAEVPTIAATPAVMAAIRNATGLALTRAPIRPDDIALAME
jgi:CO/xanthine dehydrogenase Mo-binding subunit